MSSIFVYTLLVWGRLCAKLFLICVLWRHGGSAGSHSRKNSYRQLKPQLILNSFCLCVVALWGFIFIQTGKWYKSFNVSVDKKLNKLCVMNATLFSSWLSLTDPNNPQLNTVRFNDGKTLFWTVKTKQLHQCSTRHFLPSHLLFHWWWWKGCPGCSCRAWSRSNPQLPRGYEDWLGPACP